MEKVKKPLWKRWWMWAIAVVVIIVFAASQGGKNQPASTQTQAQQNSSAAKSEPPKNSPKITKAEFDQIQTGMTYEQVTQIVGGPGELMAESGDGQYKMQTYKWDGEKGFGSNATVTFMGGKVQAKAQIGLE